ncbi:growth-regulating factor 9 isoform X1 [Lactuca sativa]|uniref:Growth-regulating factor n=1 Tax=Lactuca sativa TaxID=4236 RepID=A0A9R1XKF5_LACSA|nr:growth-regulating factor 9 isoform X1 [Lactuca sativa]KAJ0218080.1 hypothetical protein LSAT_V11C300154290 [Lactuca sativa]
MDLEPGRCRRTDGKKWRCRLAVLPDQKYCERHIHRGCLRSRKPVEDHMSKSTAKITVSPLKSTINLTKSDARKDKSVCIKNRNNSFKIKKRSREDDARVPLEFSFSPKSVLQNDNAQHSGNSRNNHNNHNLVVVPESARCRRTDGKNWRCTKITLQGQKYCAQHMHRGVKKVQNYQNSNTSLSFSVGASYVQKGSSGNQSNESSDSDDDDDDDGRDPNGATNSSSSDATTISM